MPNDDGRRKTHMVRLPPDVYRFIARRRREWETIGEALRRLLQRDGKAKP